MDPCDWPQMQAAFLLVFALPPPAAGALGLAGSNGARAGRAADREEAALVQHIVGNIVRRDVPQDVVAVPVGQRADLDQLVGLVECGDWRCGAVLGLVGAQSRDPSVGAGERAPE